MNSTLDFSLFFQMESYGRELHDSTDLHELCLRSQKAEQAEQTKSMRLWGRQLVKSALSASCCGVDI